MVRKSRKATIKTEIFQTEEKNVKCTKLPDFIRAKKYLGAPFCVYFQDMPEVENIKCTISAGNFKNPNAELKNNECIIKNGIAEFHDLRFLGKSGRGTKFNVYIQLETNPPKIITYYNAIKVTVDGPRPPRIVKPKVQEAIKNCQELTALKRKNDEQKHKLLSQPMKKRFIQTYFMEEEMYSNVCSSNSSEISFNSSPALSPNPISDTNKIPNKCYISCCTSFETLSLEQEIRNDDAYTSQSQYYKDLINKYLILFMNMYKIKITDDLIQYLVNLILNKTLCSVSSNAHRVSLESNVNFSNILEDEQFLTNFQLFYSNLVQNFVKTDNNNNNNNL